MTDCAFSSLISWTTVNKSAHCRAAAGGKLVLANKVSAIFEMMLLIVKLPFVRNFCHQAQKFLNQSQKEDRLALLSARGMVYAR